MDPDPLDDLAARLERERLAADRVYNDRLTALDRALATGVVLPPAPGPLDRSALPSVNQRTNILPDGPPPLDRSIKGRLTGLVWRLIGPALQRQAEFNAAVAEHLNRTADAQDRWVESAVALRAALHAELQALAHFQALLVQYLQAVTAYVDTKDRSLGAGAFRERLSMAEQRLQAIKREVDRLASAGAPAAASAGPVPPAIASPVDAVSYVGFEDRYRGTPDDIGRRVEDYVPMLAAAGDVIDVGCGRGELLTALHARGVKGRGVDSNAAMVELCRARGLDVEHGDAVAFLERQPDAGAGAIAAIQVVEHFEPAYLSRFLDTAFHKLKPGGALVLETINAACWMAFFETYLRDLTHQRPLHPDTLRYLVEASGFSAVDVRFRQPVSGDDRLEQVAVGAGDTPLHAVARVVNDHAEKLNARLFSSMDYAVIARR